MKSFEQFLNEANNVGIPNEIGYLRRGIYNLGVTEGTPVKLLAGFGTNRVMVELETGDTVEIKSTDISLDGDKNYSKYSSRKFISENN